MTDEGYPFEEYEDLSEPERISLIVKHLDLPTFEVLSTYGAPERLEWLKFLERDPDAAMGASLHRDIEVLQAKARTLAEKFHADRFERNGVLKNPHGHVMATPDEVVAVNDLLSRKMSPSIKGYSPKPLVMYTHIRLPGGNGIIQTSTDRYRYASPVVTGNMVMSDAIVATDPATHTVEGRDQVTGHRTTTTYWLFGAYPRG